MWLIMTNSNMNIMPVHFCMLNYMKLVKLAYKKKKTLGCYFSVLHLAPWIVYRPFHSPFFLLSRYPWYVSLISEDIQPHIIIIIIACPIFQNIQKLSESDFMFSCKRTCFSGDWTSLSSLVNIIFLLPVVWAGITVRKFSTVPVFGPWSVSLSDVTVFKKHSGA